MEYDTIFYICGSVLAAAAVTTAFIGLRSQKFPGRAAPAVALGFIALIGLTTTYAVLNGKHEEEARAEELQKANEEDEALENQQTGAAAGASESPSSAAEGQKPAAAGPGGTLKLAASATGLAFDKKSLESKPGKVTIDFRNPAAIEHDVAIEKDGKVIASSETISEGSTSVSADLKPGTYTFLCTVPGHAEAGMEGTLTVR